MRNLILFPFLLIASLHLQGQEAKKPVFTLHGTASVSFGIFQQDNYDGRQPGFFWSLNGNPVLGVFGHPAPLSVMISSQQRSLSGPFSQIGISPTVKWAKFHLGVRSLQWSPFSVAGHTFLGGAVELNPGAFRFGLLGGRFQKAREQDTTGIVRLRPQYQRLGYGVKIGVGKTRNYFDLLFFKAKDDSTSLKNISRKDNLTPDENAVLGISSRLYFTKRISLRLDGGASLFTHDQRSELLSETSGDAGLRRFAKAFEPVMAVRNSTNLTFAGQADLRYQGQTFQLGLNYRRVDPDYASMGAWFFQTDIEQWSLTPGFSFKKGRTRLQFNGGLQRDNLLHLKPATSRRLISGVNVSLNPNDRFGIEFQANNFQFNQENRYLDSDSLRLQQSTLFLNIAPHWTQQGLFVNRTLNASVTYQKSDDYNPYTRQNLRSDFVFGQLASTWQWPQKGLNASLGLNGRANKSGTAADDQSIGLTAGAGKSFLKNRLSLQVNGNANVLLRKAVKPGSSFGGGCSISFKCTKNTRIYTNAYFLSNHTVQRSFQYLSIAGGFEYTF